LISGSVEEGFELTPSGMHLYERVMLPQQAIRQRAAAAIAEVEHATTVAVLQAWSRTSSATMRLTKAKAAEPARLHELRSPHLG
jgi:hypothetical protein